MLLTTPLDGCSLVEPLRGSNRAENWEYSYPVLKRVIPPKIENYSAGGAVQGTRSVHTCELFDLFHGSESGRVYCLFVRIDRTSFGSFRVAALESCAF